MEIMKYQVVQSIRSDMFRYEDIDHARKLCIWGVGFTHDVHLNIQNYTCTECGNFVQMDTNKVVNMKTECTCFVIKNACKKAR